MKFNKEDAVEKLNAALTNDGKKTLRLSKRTLESQTETLMALIADEEMELDDFVSKVKPMMEVANSNAEHDQSEFIKEYQKAHPEVRPKESKSSEEAKSEVQMLLERLEAMERKEKEREQASLLATKRSDITKYLSENNVTDKQWIEKMLGMVNIGADESVEEKGKSLLELYNATNAAKDTPTPDFPKAGGAEGSDTFAELRELRKARNSQNM